jgi:hypothetical protein
VYEVLARIGDRAEDWQHEIAELLEEPVSNIEYPFMFSIDNDNKHRDVLRLLLSDDMPYPDVHEDDFEAVRALQSWDFGVYPVADERDVPRLCDREYHGGMSFVGPPLRDECLPVRERYSSQSHDAKARPVAATSSTPSFSGASDSSWRRRRPRHRRFLWKQLAPLPKSAPELHSLIEHANRTAEAAVSSGVRSLDVADPDLLLLKTYQGFLDKADRERLSGENGRKHVHGSLRKLVFVAKWMAADKGVLLEVPLELQRHHSGGEWWETQSSKRRRKIERVEGLAGQKPPTPYWC